MDLTPLTVTPTSTEDCLPNLEHSNVAPTTDQDTRAQRLLKRLSAIEALQPDSAMCTPTSSSRCSSLVRDSWLTDSDVQSTMSEGSSWDRSQAHKGDLVVAKVMRQHLQQVRMKSADGDVPNPMHYGLRRDVQDKLVFEPEYEMRLQKRLTSIRSKGEPRKKGPYLHRLPSMDKPHLPDEVEEPFSQSRISRVVAMRHWALSTKTSEPKFMLAVSAVCGVFVKKLQRKSMHEASAMLRKVTLEKVKQARLEMKSLSGRIALACNVDVIRQLANFSQHHISISRGMSGSSCCASMQLQGGVAYATRRKRLQHGPHSLSVRLATLETYLQGTTRR